MPEPAINYAAVLADLEAKRAELDAAIAAIKIIIRQTGSLAATSPAVPRVASLSQVPSKAFVGLSTSNAARKLLEMMQRRLTMKEIMQGLQAGGLKPNKYRNIYSILRQREAYKADLINVNAKWGLAEWNPEIPPRSNMIPEKKQRPGS
jgi:predicted glycosyltransferase